GKSPFFIKMQADGRARGIEKNQQVITAVPTSLIEAMAENFNDPSLLSLEKGGIPEGKELLQKLFTFIWGQHVAVKESETRLLALHQMTALVQQTLLDGVYENPELQARLFSTYAFLF